MDRTPVVAAHLASVGYDPATGTLEVAFTGGAVYQYLSVPEGLYWGLLAATGSHDDYFDAFIKNAGFAYARVT